VAALAGALAVAAAVLRIARPRPLAGVLLRLGLAAGLLAGAGALRRSPVAGPGTPGMAPYDGEPVRVMIRNISPPGRIVRFDVVVNPDPSR
jgi:hypothetical protein